MMPASWRSLLQLGEFESEATESMTMAMMMKSIGKSKTTYSTVQEPT